jgi:magnesium transporter
MNDPAHEQACHVRRVSADGIDPYAIASVPIACAEESVGSIITRMIGARFEDVSHVYVVDGTGRFAGAVEFRTLLAAPSATQAADLIVSGEEIALLPDCDRETAASIAIRSCRTALPLVDHERRFIGALPAQALLSILRDEHIEDLHHIVGILSRSDAARDALAASPWRRALFRLPWLALGLACSAVSALMMSGFEEALKAHVAVAFFVPTLVYLADAVGTQSEVVAVRMLSLNGNHLPSMVATEIGTGALIGAALALAAGPVIWLAFGDPGLATAVAIALAAACACASLLGFLLPWLFDRIGIDPALGSGPIATAFQDLASIAIYLAVAQVLVF